MTDPSPTADTGERYEWIAYDHETRQPVPQHGELVWIHDEFYEGVTLGQWVGWWENYGGSDDVGVTHWMPLVRPPAPPSPTDRSEP